MNLRDKLKAIEKPKSPPKALEKQFTDCYHGREMRELSEFPGAFDLDLSALRLMTQETLPDDLNPRNILYLDTETTGFMGAGTVAFEVGMGCLTDSGFQIHQLVMRDYPEEKFLLQSIADTLMGYDAICTFNGRTFDVPLLRDRFLMNRMDDSCLDKPHIDLLHMARRVFKLRLQRCNLGKLEEAVLGIPRFDDLPGAQVPQRFFDYLKTGNFDLLADVLEHNAQDVASLCVLLTAMVEMYRAPENVRHDEDVFSMGVALERFQHVPEARKCYQLTSGNLHAQGQERLAQSYRRGGERDEAVKVWLGMIARHEGGTKPYIELAKHYEHYERDYESALDMTRRAMALSAEPSLFDPPSVQEEQNALQYRYDRLKKKAAKNR